MANLSSKARYETVGGHRFGTVDVQLPDDHDCDIQLRLPNGEVISLQYRLEVPSIDVCFPDDVRVTNWKGDDMDPADFDTGEGGGEHVRFAKQLVIDFPGAWSEEPVPADASSS